MWSPIVLRSLPLLHADPCALIRWMQSKSHFFVLSSSLRAVCKVSPHVYVGCSVSVQHPACPERKGYVRAGLTTPSGWVVKVISEDPPMCGCTWLSVTMLGGSVPKQVSPRKCVAMFVS